MKKVSLFIVVVFASCSAPRQLAPVTVEKIVTLHDTILVSTPVPATEKSENFIVDGWDGGDFFDTFTVEDSTSKATVIATGNRAEKKRSYYVTTTRKVDTIRLQVPIYIRDTITIECPPTLPALPSDGKFPWWWVLAAMGALSVWWVGKRRKTS